MISSRPVRFRGNFIRRHHFVTHEMQPDRIGFLLVEEVGGDGLANMGSQLVPVIALGEYVMRQALSNKAAIRFLCDAKDNFLARKLSQSQ